MLTTLKTQSREEQVHANDLVRQFSCEKVDRPGTVVATEQTAAGKTLVVFIPEPKIESDVLSANLLGQLKGLVAGLEKAATPKQPKSKRGKASDQQQSDEGTEPAATA